MHWDSVTVGRSWKRVCGGIVLFAVVFIASPATAMSDRVETFTLIDHRNMVQKIEFPSSRNTLIIAADRQSAAEAQVWGNILFNNLSASTNFVAVAELGGVPEFFAGVVRSSIKSKRPRLLDWGNKFGKKWGFQDGHALVMLVDPAGKIITRVVGPYVESKLAQFGVPINTIPATSTESVTANGGTVMNSGPFTGQ